MYVPESKISNALENNSFAASFMHLKLRKITSRMEKSKWGVDYKIMKKIVYSPRVLMADFKGVLTWMLKNNEKGLLTVKINLLMKML